MTKNWTVITILLFIFCTSILGANPLLTLEQENESNHGISVSISADKPIRSFFTSGKVAEVTGQDDNFGMSVTILTRFDVTFKGNPIQEEIYTLYSNLKSVSVEKGQAIDDQTVLGLTGGSGTVLHPDTNDLIIYLYTEKPSPLMSLKTKDQYIFEDSIYWWNPGFLFKK